jgi:Ig-like domain from next to BRCA1 gene
MKEQSIRRSFLWIIAVVLLQACASPAPTPSPLPPDKLGTVVAGTVGAAQTQTDISFPPSSTPTLTRTPSLTPTVATPTATFFFSLPTLSPTPTQTPLIPTALTSTVSGRSGTATSNANASAKEWICGIAGKTSPVVSPEAKFSLSYTLRNTGTKTWTFNGVDYVYLSGFRHEGTRIKDLPTTITPGNTITLRIQFIAPKKPGVYNSIWTLTVGNHPFCRVKLSFEVK